MGALLFSPSGRIGPADFIRGAIALSVLLFLVKISPLAGIAVSGIVQIVGLVLIYCWLALFIKRYHDAGKSGWLALIPVAIIVGLGAFFVNGLVTEMVAPELLESLQDEMIEATSDGFGSVMQVSQGETAQELARTSAFPVALTRAAMAFSVAYLTNMMTKSDPGPNQYGPPTI